MMPYFCLAYALEGYPYFEDRFENRFMLIVDKVYIIHNMIKYHIRQFSFMLRVIQFQIQHILITL